MSSEAFLSGSSQPQYYSEMSEPASVALYQTPKKALSHGHFIKNALVGSIAGFLINWGIGALFTLGKDRLFLWVQPKPYDFGTNSIKPGAPIWLEVLLTVFLSVFIGHPLNAWGAKQDVKKGQAMPIQSHDLVKYRWLGVTITNSWLRAFVFSIYATLIVYSSTMLVLFLACDNGSMYRVPIPPLLETPGECYMIKKYYVLLKGLIAALAGLSICWMQEWAVLNKECIPDEIFEEYVSIKSQGHTQNVPDVNLPNTA